MLLTSATVHAGMSCGPVMLWSLACLLGIAVNAVVNNTGRCARMLALARTTSVAVAPALTAQYQIFANAVTPLTNFASSLWKDRRNWQPTGNSGQRNTFLNTF